MKTFVYFLLDGGGGGFSVKNEEVLPLTLAETLKFKIKTNFLFAY